MRKRNRFQNCNVHVSGVESERVMGRLTHADTYFIQFHVADSVYACSFRTHRIKLSSAIKSNCQRYKKWIRCTVIDRCAERGGETIDLCFTLSRTGLCVCVCVLRYALCKSKTYFGAEQATGWKLIHITLTPPRVIHSHATNDIKINTQHSIFLRFFFLLRFAFDAKGGGNTCFFVVREKQKKNWFIVGDDVCTMNFNSFHVIDTAAIYWGWIMIWYVSKTRQLGNCEDVIFSYFLFASSFATRFRLHTAFYFLEFASFFSSFRVLGRFSHLMGHRYVNNFSPKSAFLGNLKVKFIASVF